MSDKAIMAPPVFSLDPRAGALLEKLETGGRGEWRQGAGMQDQSVVVRAQAAREFAGEPDPYLRGGRIAARTLELMAVNIDPLHLFAASAIMPNSVEARQEAYAYLGTQPALLGHSHHISMDYAKLLRLGVRGVLAEIDAADARLTDGAEAETARALYQGMRLALQGLVHYGARYCEEAERLLASETDPLRRAELARMIDALRRVPLEPAATFYEAIQSFLLLHFGSRTLEADSAVGRIDLYMGPYYARDLTAGRITQAEAARWVQILLAQLQELSCFSDCIVLGGCAADGHTPCWNDLTYFMLDAVAQLKQRGPEIGFRYTPGQPRDLMRRALACIRAGTGHPGFFNDPIVIAALERSGMTREQAADYANCNCVELTSAGRSYILSGYGYYNLAKMVEVLLHGESVVTEQHNWFGNTPPPPEGASTEYASFAELLDAFERYLDAVVDQSAFEMNAHMRKFPASTFLPLSSAFIEGCIERGKHCALGGAVCSQTFPNFVGVINAVDSLAAIRQAVFEEKCVTWAELAAACRANFVGQEALRQYLLRDCPKYGNDDPRVDALAARFFNRIAARLTHQRNIYGYAYAPQYFGWLGHGVRGQYTGATPDGRLSGAAVSGTLGGDHGTDTSGPTALLKSATSFDHTLASGGLAVNLALSPSALQTNGDVERLIDLTLAYFALGGMQLQLNCVAADTLRDAQAHPDQYRQLQVRVAGFSDRFVLLAENLQEEIISRTAHEGS